MTDEQNSQENSDRIKLLISPIIWVPVVIIIFTLVIWL